MIQFPIKALLSEEECHDYLERTLHPEGLRCPRGHPLPVGQAPHDPPESIIAIIYLQWVVFGMIFEELNPARHWLVLPVGIKGRSPKSIAGKIEQSDMSFRPIN